MLPDFVVQVLRDRFGDNGRGYYFPTPPGAFFIRPVQVPAERMVDVFVGSDVELFWRSGEPPCEIWPIADLQMQLNEVPTDPCCWPDGEGGCESEIPTGVD